LLKGLSKEQLLQHVLSDTISSMWGHSCVYAMKVMCSHVLTPSATARVSRGLVCPGRLEVLLVMRQRVTCVSVGPPLADRRLPVEMIGC
jgi:hypothetical protein